MKKGIKFRDYLVPLVLSGEKTATWRLFDDKDLAAGDLIDLNEFGKEEPFGTAEITHVITKKFGDLTTQDKIGHESYSSDEEMYKTFSRYYKTQVTAHTELKIIHFKLMRVS